MKLLFREEQEETNIVMLPTMEELLQKKRGMSLIDKDDRNGAEKDATALFEADNELKQRERSMKAAAEKILEDARTQARAQAQMIIEEANRQRDRIYDQAREEGFASGRVEVFAQAADALALLDDGYCVAVKNLEQTRLHLFEQMEEHMLETAVFIAQKIMHIEFDRNDEAFLSIVRNALQMVLNQKNLVLRVSDWEYKRFFAEGASALAVELEAREIKVCKDSLLEKSECRLETEYGGISVGIETQLKRLGHALGTNW